MALSAWAPKHEGFGGDSSWFIKYLVQVCSPLPNTGKLAYLCPGFQKLALPFLLFFTWIMKSVLCERGSGRLPVNWQSFLSVPC